MSNFEAEHKRIESTFLSSLAEKDESSLYFKELIYHYFDHRGRSFPWRKTTNPYHIFISEVMLQQTQADRVVEKYNSWIDRFKSFEELAKATFPEVLQEWQGLGYNRRARFLHESAKKSIEHFNGSIPDDPEKLVNFPGIGPNTAASITAFAFNKPVVFIETNIRAVYLHFFFRGKSDIDDKQLMPIIRATLDSENPREWYNALMDYGTMLKKKFKNPSRKSKHHIKQKPFKGSDREIRGQILKLLVEHNSMPIDDVAAMIDKDPIRVQKNIQSLEKEGFIQAQQEKIQLSK